MLQSSVRLHQTEEVKALLTNVLHNKFNDLVDDTETSDNMMKAPRTKLQQRRAAVVVVKKLAAAVEQQRVPMQGGGKYARLRLAVAKDWCTKSEFLVYIYN